MTRLKHLLDKIGETIRGADAANAFRNHQKKEFEVRMQLEELQEIHVLLMELRDRRANDSTSKSDDARQRKKFDESMEETIRRMREQYDADAASYAQFGFASGRRSGKNYQQYSYGNSAAEEPQPNQRSHQGFGGFGGGFTFEDFDEALRQAGFGSQQRQAPPPKPDPSAKHWSVTLEVPLTATNDEIKKAYRRLVQKYHPDRAVNDRDREQRTTITQGILAAWDDAKRERGIDKPTA